MHKRLMMGLAVCLCTLPLPLAAAPFDGSAPMLCAAIDVFECTAQNACVRSTAESVNLPTFIRLDVAAKTLGSAGVASRTTPVERVEHLHGRLILQGGENGRGWSMIVTEDTGKFSASVSDDQVGFIVFGACTLP